MSDQNEMIKSRGKNLFVTKINQEIASQTSKNAKENLKQLRDFFQDQVAVVESADKSCFAAVRLAKSCIDVASNCEDAITDINTAEIIEATLTSYKSIPISHLTSSVSESPTQNEVKRELQKEIETHELKTHGVPEVIDLLRSVDISEMRAEGKRAVGLLPANFDSSVDNEEDFEIKEDDSLCAIMYGDEDNVTLACPKCLSTDLFIEMSKGTCLSCDCEFETTMGLGDIISDEPIQPTLYNASNQRIDGKIKNRGLIIKGE